MLHQKQPPQVFFKKCVLKNFVEFTGKDLRQSLFFNKIASLRSTSLIKNRVQRRCFPVNFAKLLRTLFYRTPLDDCICSINLNQVVKNIFELNCKNIGLIIVIVVIIIIMIIIIMVTVIIISLFSVSNEFQLQCITN